MVLAREQEEAKRFDWLQYQPHFRVVIVPMPRSTLPEANGMATLPLG